MKLAFALVLSYFMDGQLYMVWGPDYPTMEVCNSEGSAAMTRLIDAGLPVASTGFVCLPTYEVSHDHP